MRQLSIGVEVSTMTEKSLFTMQAETPETTEIRVSLTNVSPVTRTAVNTVNHTKKLGYQPLTTRHFSPLVWVLALGVVALTFSGLSAMIVVLQSSPSLTVDSGSTTCSACAALSSPLGCPKLPKRSTLLPMASNGTTPTKNTSSQIQLSGIVGSDPTSSTNTTRMLTEAAPTRLTLDAATNPVSSECLLIAISSFQK